MCRKLSMEEHSEDIITLLNSRIKKSITVADLLQCHKEVIRVGNGPIETEKFADQDLFRGNLSHECSVKKFAKYTDVRHLCAEFSELARGFVHKEPNGNIHLESSTSDVSLLNSGAEYDSGAQDLCDEPQSLHLLMKCENPELYRLAFPAHVSYATPPPPAPAPQQSSRLTATAARESRLRNNGSCASSSNPGDMDAIILDTSSCGAANEPAHPHVHCLSHPAVSPSDRKDTTSLLLNDSVADHSPDWVRRLFNCANLLHLRQTKRLRSEMRDLTRHLHSLQASRDLGYREAKRLQRERNQLRDELSSQVTRYEDRLTELHSVIAELRRRLERTEIQVISEVDEHEGRAVRPDRCKGAGTSKKELSPQACSVTMVEEACEADHIFSPVRPDGDAVSEGSTDGDTSVGAVDGDDTELRCDALSQKGRLLDGINSVNPDGKTSASPHAVYGCLHHCNCHSAHMTPSRLQWHVHPNPGDARYSEETTTKSPQAPILSEPNGLTRNQGSTDLGVSDCPEPEWVTTALNAYYKLADASEIKIQAPEKHHHEDQQFQGQHTWTGVDDSILTGPLSPGALFQLLYSISKLAPYPRLAEVAHCAQLTWSRLLTTVGRLQSDCLVLQTNLADAKATADRMQCRLNQIEANWDAAVLVTSLAEACLEISDCLNQLYSTELAILLYQDNHQSMLSGQVFSTMSSSTSSSSLQGRSVKPQEFRPKVSGVSAKNPPSPQPPNPSLHTSCSPQQHPYAVYAIPGSSLCTESCQTQPHGTQFAYIPLNSQILKVNRHHAESSAHALLRRCELVAQGNEQLYPTASSSSNSTAPSSSLGRTFTRLLQQAPLSPGWFSTHSPLGHNVPSTHSLTSTSLYANSWYVSLSHLGRQSAVNTTGRGERMSTLENCVGSESLPVRTKVSMTNVPSNNSNVKSSKSALMTTTQHQTPVSEMGRGWQTPDSGAGSSSTNETAQQPLIHPFLRTADFLTAADIHGDLLHNACSVSLLDALPPVWSRSKHWTRRHSICDYDSDSSDSSGAVTTGVQEQRHGDQPQNTSSLMRLSASTWTRLEERKLRTILGQLFRALYRLKSTIIELSSHSSVSDDDNESRRLWDSIRNQDGSGQLLSSISLASIGKRPLNVLLENAVLLQELCCVKEERADLKARVYLLEKELHANRLMLESHRAAESALRAHLDALTVERKCRRTSQEENGGKECNPIDGQPEVALLRGQVRNLLQALEALRHSSELQQLQSEELVDDLKRANTALIGAYEKAKRKYLARIKRLEDQIQTTAAMPAVTGNAFNARTASACTTAPGTPAEYTRSNAICRQNHLTHKYTQNVPPLVSAGECNPVSTSRFVTPVSVAVNPPSTSGCTESVWVSAPYAHWNSRPLPAVPVNESSKHNSAHSVVHAIKTSKLRGTPNSNGEQTRAIFLSTQEVP
ncbi:unnamed protein product [Dicrocoelium dendriticum]|nr:unnamed protein product [Dicrocoelium dendriticum]